MLTALFMIKATAILLTLFVLSFFFYKRNKLSNKHKNQFKHNVSLLREEKLLICADKKLKKKRHQLLRKIKISGDVTQKQLVNKSKKLGVPTGEILLAAKIQMSCR
jgi:hypothetical protein